MNNPRASILIPTRDAARHLRACLAAVTALRPPYPLEIIVVDNGSSDGSDAVAAEFAGVRLVAADRKKGSYYARNVGIAAARGEHLFFADADVLAPPSWLPERLEAKVYGGGVRLVSSNAFLEAFFRAGGHRSTVTGGRLFGCNMGYHRSVFDEFGPFREVESGEDHRFSMEVLKRHALSPLPEVSHWIDAPLEYLGKMYKYGKGTPCAYPAARAPRKLAELAAMSSSSAALRVLAEAAYLIGYAVGPGGR
ncbi:MAG: hypothetical protein A2V88_13200 [Elusimicrobia bacterium RBG_16_66_12]|nr:MAG: hypothetical protein A2V88_13200 [Elusimicrobia bacterium RBG_16_66_12]